jgi:hypothetical protein
MGNIGSFVNLLLGDAAGRAMGRFGLNVLDSLIGLIYLIWTLIARITDWLQVGFELLAGANRGEIGQDTVSMIINNPGVQTVFWNLVAVCTALMVFFTIIKIIMDQYSSKAKGGNPYKQVFTMFKGMLLYFFITGFVMVAMFASGIIFKALKNATGGGSTKISAIVWRQMTYDANRLRADTEGASDGEGKDGQKIDFNAQDERYYRLIPDSTNPYTSEWDKKKMYLLEVGPKTVTPAGVLRPDDYLYEWGYLQDDGSAVPVNPISTSAEDEVEWRDGTVYDDSLWGSGFATTDQSFWSDAGETADGGWGAGASGASQTTFNNPIMEAVVVTVNIGIDARFQPLYYVKKGFTLQQSGPTISGNLHITALGTGGQITYDFIYYNYDDHGQPVGYGYEKFDGNEYSKLGFDISAGLSFSSKGTNMGFSIGAFTPKFEQILGDLVVANTIAMAGDAVMVAISGKSFPLGFALFGAQVIDGRKLLAIVGRPIINGGMSSYLTQAAGMELKNPFDMDDDANVGISFLRPMNFDEFMAFWEGVGGQLFDGDGGGSGGGAGQWGTTGALAKAKAFEKEYGIGTDPETGEPRGGSQIAKEIANTYEQAANDVMAQLRDQMKWLTYNYYLSSYQEALSSSNIGDTNLVDAISKYLFNAAFLAEINGTTSSYTNLGTDTTGIKKIVRDQQDALRNHIAAMANSSTYKKIITGDRPSIMALPYIENNSNTVYNPIAVGSGSNKFTIDLLPEYDLKNQKTYLTYAIDWAAYGQTTDNMNKLKEFSTVSGSELVKKQIDFDKYIAQYINDLSGYASTTAESNELEIIRGEIGARLVDEYSAASKITSGDGVDIVFAVADAYYGMSKTIKDENKLENLLGGQSVAEESTATVDITTQEHSWESNPNNETVQFVHLQDGTTTGKALKDQVQSTRVKNITTLFSVTGMSPLHSFGLREDGALANAEEGTLVPKESTEIAIDKLMAGEFQIPDNKAYVLAIARNDVGEYTEGKPGDVTFVKGTNTGTFIDWLTGYIKVEPARAATALDDIIGVPSYYNMKAVQHLYKYTRMDFVTGFICILVAMGVYMNFTFGLIQRLLNLAVLYLISPLTLAYYPFDEGGKFNSHFVQPFYRNVVSAYSLVLSMNLFFVLFPTIRDEVTKMFKASGAGPVTTMFFGAITTMALISMLPKIKDSINGVLGGENIEQKSLADVAKSAKEAAGSGVGQIAGAAKMVGKVGVKAGGIVGGVARRIGVNMDANKADRIKKWNEKHPGQSYEKDSVAAKVGGVAAKVGRGGAALLTLGGSEAVRAIEKKTQIFSKVGNGVAAAGGFVAKKVANNAVVKGIGESVFLGDNVIGKTLRYHSAKEKNERESKDEDTLKGYALAKYDAGVGIGVKQVGMAIEKERQARELLAKDPNSEEGKRLQAAAKEDLQKGGFTGGEAGLNKLMDVEARGGNWVAMAQGMVGKDASAWRRDGSLERAADPMSTIRREMVVNQINTLPDAVKTQIGSNPTLQAALDSKNPAKMSAAFTELAEKLSGTQKANVEEIARTLGRMPSGGTGGASFAVGEMAGALSKTLGEHLKKEESKLDASVQNLNSSIERSTKMAEQAANNPAFDGQTQNALKELADAAKALQTGQFAGANKDVATAEKNLENARQTLVMEAATNPQMGDFEKQLLSQFSGLAADLQSKKDLVTQRDNMTAGSSVLQRTALKAGGSTVGNKPAAGGGNPPTPGTGGNN